MRPREAVTRIRTDDALSVYRAPRELPSLRDAADTMFRQRRLILVLCFVLSTAVAAFVILSPRLYEAEMTILVKNIRAEVMLTPDESPSAIRQTEINDAQMGTEVQLLSSRELFAKVVDQLGLAGPTPADRERAIGKLQKKVSIAPVMKSSMIRVRYASTDPKLSARVLKTLGDAYLERHLQLHSSAGSFAFFQSQADVYEHKLADAQARLVDFQQKSGVVSGAEEKDLLLRRLVDIGASLRESQATWRDTQQRIGTLQTQLAGVAPRITTQQRRIPNQYSVERLNTMLAELQNKRTELLTKFKPGDRMIKSVDQQIAETQQKKAEAERMNATEEATDVNPIRQTLETELARTQQTADGLRARIDTLTHQSGEYRSQLERLEGVAPSEQEILREIKVAEENYLLYSRKREEARISEAMDQQKIANIAISEPPHVPALPLPRVNMSVIAGYMAGVIVILLAAFVFGSLRRTIYTPWDLESFAMAPVLGTVANVPVIEAQRKERRRR